MGRFAAGWAVELRVAPTPPSLRTRRHSSDIRCRHPRHHIGTQCVALCAIQPGTQQQTKRVSTTVPARDDPGFRQANQQAAPMSAAAEIAG